MNVVTVILVLLFLCLLLGIAFRVSDRRVTLVILFVGGLLAVVLVNNFLHRIPNPFELPVATTEDAVRAQRPISSIVDPGVAADPDDAARRQADILDRARGIGPR